MSRRGDSNVTRLLREALANTPEKGEDLAALTQEINHARGLNAHAVKFTVNSVNQAGYNKMQPFAKYAYEAEWWKMQKHHK